MILEIIAEDWKNVSVESPSVAIKCKQLLLLERRGITVCKCKVQTIRLNLCGPLLYLAVTLPFLYLNSAFCLLVFFCFKWEHWRQKALSLNSAAAPQNKSVSLSTQTHRPPLNASLCLGRMLLVRKLNRTCDPHNKAKDGDCNAFSCLLLLSTQNPNHRHIVYPQGFRGRCVYLACNAGNRLSMLQTCGLFRDLRVPLVPTGCTGPKLFCGCVFSPAVLEPPARCVRTNHGP